jgi:hypothetical protein
MTYTSDALYVRDVQETSGSWSFPMPGRRQQKREVPKRAFKAYTPFSPDEIELIDRWGFAKHIRNRADAVRFLVMKALASEGIRLGAR